MTKPKVVHGVVTCTHRTQYYWKVLFPGKQTLVFNHWWMAIAFAKQAFKQPSLMKDLESS